MGVNAQFVLGVLRGMNSVGMYPIVFNGAVTVMAIIGGFLIAFDKRQPGRFFAILLLGLWFAVYFGFYCSFYAGAATFGVDSRFMLQLLPSLSILAAAGVCKLGDGARALVARGKKKMRLAGLAAGVAVAGVAFSAVAAYPFIALMPLTTISPGAMPQQTVILKAMNFFYGNHSSVPSGCVVYSFTPDIWYEVGVNSSQIGYLSTSGNLSSSTGFRNCAVLDYGYWCLVPPYHDTLCKQLSNAYALTPLATSGNGNSAYYLLGNK
ncbi:Uncharacterised protein [uncultured archaeon]|nr:Uncharacterised protein [uncultured archaeon]